MRNQYRAVGWDTAIGASGTVLAARGVLSTLEDNPATTISPRGLRRSTNGWPRQATWTA